jgi:hypothetical protein
VRRGRRRKHPGFTNAPRGLDKPLTGSDGSLRRGALSSEAFWDYPIELRAGEIRLIDSTPEESAAAKLRLEDHRGKRKERDRLKKAES